MGAFFVNKPIMLKKSMQTMALLSTNFENPTKCRRCEPIRKQCHVLILINFQVVFCNSFGFAFLSVYSIMAYVFSKKDIYLRLVTNFIAELLSKCLNKVIGLFLNKIVIHLN